MATIRDIAKKANVAVSTVSYVLNNTKSVKPETKEKIMKIVQELDYQPNIVAQSLKTKKTLTIGAIVPDISNMFFTGIIRGIEDVANKYGYSVILCNTDEDQQKEEKYINMLYNKDIDGLIFVGTTKNHQLFSKRRNLPIVIVDRKIGSGFSSIMVNNVMGGFIATNYLLEKNNSDVFLLTGPLTINTYFERMTGYIKALKSKKMEYNESFVQQCSMDFRGGYESVEIILERKMKVRSVFATNDFIALGAMKAFYQRGIKIPEDVSIVGYDDIPTAEIVTPALTTVEQPKYLMGEKAAQLLFNQIINEKVATEQIILEPKLIIRETT